MKVRDFFLWVRIPTIFSSLSNAYAGYFIGGGQAGVTNLILGMTAAALFLMAGMGLNDIADIKTDRLERPTRPLPSGAIPIQLAWILSLGMLMLGLTLLWQANPVSWVIGILLVLTIFLYNFVFKGTFLGPAVMGFCRLLNLLCGVALNADGLSDLLFLPFNTHWALLSLWLYIALVTYLARDEVQGNSAFRIRLFFLGMGVWAMLWFAFAIHVHSLTSVMILMVLAFHFRTLQLPFTKLWKDPKAPGSTGRTIGALLRSLPLTDVLALLAAGLGLPALLSILWMLPGPFLVKRFYST